MEQKMAMLRLLYQIIGLIEAILSKEYFKDLEYKDMVRLKDTKENSMIMKEMVMGFIIIQMETYMKENGKMVRSMELENILLKMAIVILENLLMIDLKE